VVRHVTWFVGAVENFRFYDLKVHAFTDPEVAVAEVKAEGLIKPTGPIYLQDNVLFLRAVAGLGWQRSNCRVFKKPSVE
jgi:hypothetical protein